MGPIAQYEECQGDHKYKTLLAQGRDTEQEITRKFCDSFLSNAKSQADSYKEETVNGRPRGEMLGVGRSRKRDQGQGKPASERKSGVRQTIANRHPHPGHTRKLKPNEHPGKPEDVISTDKDLGNMKEWRKERANDDEIAMRNLSIQDSPAMSQSEALVRWSEAHP